MEAKTRLHPLLITAAVSVTIFSLVGIAAVTGLLPHSSATGAPDPQPAQAAPVEQFSSVTPPLPTAAEPATAPEPVVAAPEPKPMKKPVVRHAPAHPAPVQFAQAAVPPPPPAPVLLPPLDTPPPPPPMMVAAPPPPPVCVNCGTVENFREVEVKGQATGAGAVAGGVLGAILGHQFGRGSGKDILTVAGAAGGAFAGHEAEQNIRKDKRYEISVRMQDGSLRTLSQTAAPVWRIGDRVRVVNNQVVASS
jgi:outer membrane lipoprotein SlyB